MLPTQPLAVGGILDAGIKLFRSTFVSTLGIALLAAIPYSVVNGYISHLGNQVGTLVEEGAGLDTSALVALLISVPILYLALVFAMNGIIHRQLAFARNQPASLAADAATGLKLLLPVLVAMIVYSLCMMLGFVALLVPGFIVMISMALFPLVPQMEDRGGWGGAFRSHQLVWGGNWWRVAVVLTVVSLLSMVFAFGVGLVLGIAVAMDAVEPAGILVIVVEAVVRFLTMVLVFPLVMACLIVLYNDCLLRKEGGDLDARLSELDTASAS